jgi:hypothetical protein
MHMSFERRRSLEKGTLVGHHEETIPVSPEELVPGKHFFIEDGKMLEITRKMDLRSGETQIQVHGEKTPRIFENGTKIDVYEMP